MKPFYGFTEEDLKRSDNIQFFMDTTDTSDEEEERTPKKAKVEEGKPYAVKSSPPPISTVPELFEAVEAKRETPSPSTDLPSSPPHHYLIAIYKDGDAVPIENPTFEDLRQAFPCAMSNLPPPPPPPSPPSVVKEESNTIIRKINPAFVEKHQCFYRGYQTEIKERTTACLKLGDTPVSGYLMLAIIHDHVDLVRKPIIGKLGDHTPNGTPFTVTSVKHPDSTSYEPFEVEFIGKVHGAIVPLDAEDQVHFKFPVLSSDPKNDGKKKIGKSWSLLVYIAPTKTKFIEAEEMANFGKFVDFQVLSEVRRSRVLKHESRPDKFKYPMYKNEEQNGPDLKETYEKCREKWGDNFLHYVLCNLLQYEEKDLTLEQPEQ